MINCLPSPRFNSQYHKKICKEEREGSWERVRDRKVERGKEKRSGKGRGEIGRGKRDRDREIGRGKERGTGKGRGR